MLPRPRRGTPQLTPPRQRNSALTDSADFLTFVTANAALGGAGDAGAGADGRAAMSKRMGGGCAPRRRRAFAAAVIAALALGMSHAAPAAVRHAPGAAAAVSYGPVFEWIVLDAQTGQVLGEQNADEITYPASLTKMMTLYLT